jgi:hypothetical protein
MRILTLVIALVTLLAVGVVTQSFADNYWVTTDDWGTPSVTKKRPADAMSGLNGPFKYYDQAVRAMGTGTEWGHRCYITGLCTNSRQ